jgi:hypothetical protein
MRRPVHAGDYFFSEHNLYRVENVALERLADQPRPVEYAVIEDCRTGDLIDMPVAGLLKLTPLSRR